MSQKIQKIILTLLISSTVFSAGIYESFNFMSVPVYASTSFDSDYALLNSLKTDEGSLSFSSKRSSVSGRVKSSVDEVEIKATAKDNSYEITIDDDTSDTGSCRTTINLKKNSNNRFKIKVKDPSGKKSTATYYVNIERGSSSSDSSSSSRSYYNDVSLDDIKLSDGNIDFSEDKLYYDIYVDENVSSIQIKAKPEDEDNDTVNINGVVVDEDGNYKAKVQLVKGENYVPIVVRDEDGNSTTYNLYIYRGDYSNSNNSEKKDNKQDDIYLKQLTLEDTDAYIKFKPKVTYYEINVDKDCDSIILKAEPEDDDYNVMINNDNVIESSKYRKRVYLSEGKNEIKIRVDDKEDGDSYKDYNKRTYTLVVNRAYSNNQSSDLIDENKEQQTGNSVDYSDNNNSDNNDETNKVTADSSSNNVVENNKKANQWIKNEYGQWMYNDSIGNPIKNKWFLDTNTSKWYKFNSEGILCTGFQYENNKTYYLNEDGSMAIGWKLIGGNWYYFTSDGNMVSNKWFQDGNGKWYYFYAGGVMATNVKIGGYTIGADGAMI